MLLYDVAPHANAGRPSAVYLDPEVEKWLKARTAAREVTHVVARAVQSARRTAGKWANGTRTCSGRWQADGERAKPYWQSGWLRQHDR